MKSISFPMAAVRVGTLTAELLDAGIDVVSVRELPGVAWVDCADSSDEVVIASVVAAHGPLRLVERLERLDSRRLLVALVLAGGASAPAWVGPYLAQCRQALEGP